MPWPAESAAAKPNAREAFSGFLHLETGDGSQRLDVTAAAHASVTAEVGPEVARFAMSVGDFEGALTGLLRAAETVPADGEILPSLANGPAASAAVPLKIQGSDTAGWNVVVDPLSATAAPGLRIAGLTAGAAGVRLDDDGNPNGKGAPAVFVAWLAHPDLALIASIFMTQLGSAAHRASRTRDLAPAEIGLDAANRPRAPLRLDRAPGSLLPRLSSAGLGANGRGRPTPDLKQPLTQEMTGDTPPGVSMAALTLAGVEAALPADGDNLFSPLFTSLRFDLPALGELFADTGLKPTQGDTPSDPNAQQPPPLSALDPIGLTAAWSAQAEKLARARTVLDRATPWSAKPGPVAISGLAEPFVWKTDFAFLTRTPDEFPLGAYRLGADLYAGVDALKGLNATFNADPLGELSAETSLFATAPMPDVIEFPDLKGDLAQGHVRRRALFVWSYAAASGLRYASLIKLDRTGAAQTPDGLEDFQPV